MQEDKIRLRKEIRQRITSANPETLKAWSAKIMLSVTTSQEFMNARNVFVYWSMPGEVDTHILIRSYCKEKSIYLPCIEGDAMVARKYASDEQLAPTGKFQIPEPIGTDIIHPSELDLIIVPGLAFDSKNNRLGKGKGYYDHFLRQSYAYRMGICFPFQLLETIPTEEHDVVMDIVVSS